MNIKKLITDSEVYWRCHRWWYRRMAWKNDRSLFMDMHPQLAWALDQIHERSWPLRDWWYGLWEAARIHQRIQAHRDVYGDTGEVKYWKDGRSATEIYTEARAQGWTGKRGQVKAQRRLR